jgi:hypothetical protein
MALPTDANVDLLICDAVRQTPDGKLDLAGYFPIPEVKLDPGTPLPAVVNLTFVFVLKDGDGQFRARFRILDPLGAELHRYDVKEFSKPVGHPHLLLLQINRIPIARSGNYAVLLEIAGQEYRRSVRIYQ